MAPERITGQSYTITSDVWSLGVTLLEVAQHRFPFPADGTEMQPKANIYELLTYIVRQAIPKLKDEPENYIRWSDSFKYFIECWYVHWFFSLSRLQKSKTDGSNQLGKGRFPPCNSLAHARSPLDDWAEQQESQHGAFPEDCMGLGVIDEGPTSFIFGIGSINCKGLAFYIPFAKSPPLHQLISPKNLEI